MSPDELRAVVDPLAHPICLAWPERRTAIRSWHEHIPFAMLLVDLLRPSVLVELGVHAGDSYCAFCQAVKALDLPTRCYGVDSWTGDAHSGFYDAGALDELRAHHDPRYGGFSTLVHSTFDAALPRFADGSIDLLHVDGYHTYEAVKHDVESWLPKMREGGVILLHDTNVQEHGFGVRRFWAEIKGRYRAFEFEHGYGLGVLAVGDVRSPALGALLDAKPDDAEAIRGFFGQLGRRLSLRDDLDAAQGRLEETQDALARLAREAPPEGPRASNLLQVFWDAGGKFSEAQSVTTPLVVDDRIHEVVLPLPATARGPLRVDPGSAVAYVEIYAVELEARGEAEEATGEVVARWSAASDAARLVAVSGLARLRGRASYRFLCTHEDPQLLLEGVPDRAEARPWLVRVTLRASAHVPVLVADEVRALARARARHRRRLGRREAELASAHAQLAEQAGALHALALRMAEQVDAFEASRGAWRAEHERLAADLREHERRRHSEAEELARERERATRLEARALEQASALAAGHAENARLSAQIAAGERTARVVAVDLEQRDRQLIEKDEQLRDRARQLAEKDRQLAARDGLLHGIVASRGWRVLNRYRSLKHAALRPLRRLRAAWQALARRG